MYTTCITVYCLQFYVHLGPESSLELKCKLHVWMSKNVKCLIKMFANIKNVTLIQKEGLLPN